MSVKLSQPTAETASFISAGPGRFLQSFLWKCSGADVSVRACQHGREVFRIARLQPCLQSHHRVRRNLGLCSCLQARSLEFPVRTVSVLAYCRSSNVD
jgi:hypothetical protein